MNWDIPASIRQLYRPVQPTVQGSAAQVHYRELSPAPELLEFICCYWELHTDTVLDEPFTYRVVADGCIDIFFELHTPQENFVMGFCKKYTAFPLGKRFHYVGVRFFPAMFPLLFGIDASLLSNRYEALEQVLPATAAFIGERFHADCRPEEIQQLLDLHFVQVLHSATPDPDPRFFAALDRILRFPGQTPIEKGLDTGLSPRQLRRLFNFYTGDSAKTFSQVVRFQYILRAKPSVQSLRQNKLFFDAGYYDQAHFIKEFRTFYGVTPGQAFGR